MTSVGSESLKVEMQSNDIIVKSMSGTEIVTGEDGNSLEFCHRSH